MTKQDLAATLAGVLDDPAVANGLELVAVEVAGVSHAPVVRVFIDRAGGVGIDDLVSANTWIGPALGEVPELGDDYTLEVSSPGVDRPLRKLEDFSRFAGEKAKITTSQPVGERKHFTGVLSGVEGEHVLIDVDDATYRIPYAAVSKARLDVDIDSLGKD